MSDDEWCNEPADPDSGVSRYCQPHLCGWYDESTSVPLCPHPRACERRGKCLHPRAKVRQ